MKTIIIRIYPQTQTFETNIEYFDEMGTLTNFEDPRYLVEHIYEIILPIVENHAHDSDIKIYMNRKELYINDIEQSYYDYMGE
jgi:hypothetical protein